MDTTKQHGRPLGRLVTVGVMAAVLAVLSQIAIPLPAMPLTLQTFGVALCGCLLGWRSGALAVAVYILLGAVGVPVFTGFSGGVSVLVGTTGGFIWGFLPMAALCGVGRDVRCRPLRLLPGLLGLLLCHLLGAAQYALVAHTDFLPAVLLVSVPFLVKDILSVAAAGLAAMLVADRLRAARLTL